MSAARRVWAIVPAAGRGARFDTSAARAPKQYAPLLGATVIEWALSALLREARVAGVVIALAAEDPHWPPIAAAFADSLSRVSSRASVGSKALDASGPLDASKISTTIGGSNRQESVMSGLAALEGRAQPDDWVLVHDAARPCLTAVDLAALLDAVDGEGGSGETFNGALLATPVVDTVKRERGGIAVDTVDRDGLWRALTPQIFRFAQLKQALSDAARAGVSVTDEAQSMERLGLPATLVRGSPFNIKVTRAEDLSMAEAILKGTE